MTLATAGAVDPFEDNLVLAARPLRPSTVLEQTSRFGDDVWRLDAALLQDQATGLALIFQSVPPRYRHTTKQLFFQMLTGPHPLGEQPPAIRSVRSSFVEVNRFLSWLDNYVRTAGGRTGPALCDLDVTDIEAYQRYLTTTLDHPLTRSKARRAVTLFWRYRDGLDDPLSLAPLRAERSQTSMATENTTPRIPEPVLGPLIGWAIRFVDDFAADILAANRSWSENRARLAASRVGHTGVLTDLHAYLQALVDTGSPLPGAHGKINLKFIAGEIGSSRTSLTSDATQHAIRCAAENVGMADYTWLAVPITARIENRSWIPGIAVRHPRLSMGRLARLLQTAAYILVGFFSGMRDPEIKHLRRGCLSVLRDGAGKPYRWKLSSLAFKGEPDPTGTAASWVVGAPAARAVLVLEQLQPPGQDLLFAALPHTRGANHCAKGRVLGIGATNHNLADFIEWINTWCVGHDRCDGVPMVNGADWVVTTRQFRRTIAWFIARRPGGAVAGAIAFRHLSVQMFEGYAGTSESGFRAEVESEQALARGEHLMAMIDQHDHTPLVGPAAEEANRRLGEFAEATGFAGTVVTDPHRLRRLLARADPAIYPGTFATCVFDPNKALCIQNGDSNPTDQPELADCRPLECANVALAPENLTALRDENHRIQHELSTRPGLPPLLRHRLSSRRDDITRFLDRNTERSTCPGEPTCPPSTTSA